MATKTKTIDPQAAAIRRALALEGQAVDPSAYGLSAAEKGLDTATGAYRAKYLAGLTLPDQTRTAAEAVAPDLKMTRADLEGAYKGNVDPNSPDYVDPSNILGFVQGRFQGGRDYLSRVTDAASRLWDKGTQSARFAVEDANTGLGRAQTKYGDAQARARQLLDEDRALANYEKKAQIDRKYASGGGSGITIEDVLKNPGTVGMYAAGVTKVQKADGGFDFIDTKTGQPMTVEDVQARIPGSSINDFLKGSFNQQDVSRMSAMKEPTAADQFRSDLSAGFNAFTGNKKAKKEIKQRLYAAYPDKRKEIDQAIR